MGDTLPRDIKIQKNIRQNMIEVAVSTQSLHGGHITRRIVIYPRESFIQYHKEYHTYDNVGREVLAEKVVSKDKLTRIISRAKKAKTYEDVVLLIRDVEDA